MSMLYSLVVLVVKFPDGSSVESKIHVFLIIELFSHF